MTVNFNPGRIINHDPRSLAYGAELASEPKTIMWQSQAPVLDQGKSNACVGFTFAQLLNTQFHDETRIKLLGSKDQFFDSHKAYDWYSRATEIDEFPGQMPTEDTGTSALAMCKVAEREATIKAYNHAFGFDECIKALQNGPVMVGTFWTQGMFTPRNDGFVELIGNEVGGHEYLLIGVNMEEKYCTFLTSFGPTYGDNGRFKMKFDVFDTLLINQGDCIIPVA